MATVVREGTQMVACYVLLTGRAVLYDGKQPVTELGPGDVVGEAALRQGRLRADRRSSVEPVRMVRLEGADTNSLASQLPTLRANIAAAMP